MGHGQDRAEQRRVAERANAASAVTTEGVGSGGRGGAFKTRVGGAVTPTSGLKTELRRTAAGTVSTRSDIRLKHDIVLLGRLDNGIGFYRFSYNGSHKAYVGAVAQKVQAVMPQAVARDRDG